MSHSQYNYLFLQMYKAVFVSLKIHIMDIIETIM